MCLPTVFLVVLILYICALMFQFIINQYFCQCSISINLVLQHFFSLNILIGPLALIVLEGHCVPQHPLTVQDTQHEDFSQPVPSLFLLPISPCLQIKISQQENLSSALCLEWIGFPCSSNLQGSRCLRPGKATAGGFSLQSICCQLQFF